ncbi:hypothetical protein FBALC1_04012 [Flavobacteriales bacterium ALC-1]|nr:hypothetical protein FBALC1_04012 [Flavobacteriales bacterium ALC-1]
MKALQYENFQGILNIKNLPDPKSEKHGVVIKVKATGLCLSDWHGWMGNDPDIKLPHVPGHELAGVIVEIGSDVKNFKVGERVTLPFVGGCGKCEYCNSGNHQVCDNQFQPGFTHWGSFAEYVSIHYADTNLVKLPDEIDFTTAASLGCRFATSFRAVIDQGKVKQDDWVVIHGCGGVGLSGIMIASALKAKVIAVDINTSALEKAKSVGALYTINALNRKDVANEILEITKGGAHVSIDAIGHPNVLLNSVNSLRKLGKHIQIGIMTINNMKPSIPIDKIIGRELEIIGSHGLQAYKYKDMISMILSGQLNPKNLISNTISLSDVPDILPNMENFNSSGIKIITSFK